jgi:hypothetical protein
VVVECEAAGYSPSAGPFVLSLHSPGAAESGARDRLALRISVEAAHRSVATASLRFPAWLADRL